MPAAVQITAEQLLREAKERELEVTPKAPQQKITSLSELRDFQLRKRKDYEDNIRKNRLAMQNWIKYAKFEETQGELQRLVDFRILYETCNIFLERTVYRIATNSVILYFWMTFK